MEEKKNKLLAFLKSLVSEETVEEVEVEASTEETPEAETDETPSAEADALNKLSETVAALAEKVEGFEARLSEVSKERDEAKAENAENKEQAAELLAEMSKVPAVETPAKTPSTKEMTRAERAIAMGNVLLKKK